MLRSTCDSAAKFTITSGFSSATSEFDQRRIADIAVDEAIARIVRNRRQIFKISRVGELVQIHHACANAFGSCKQQTDERTADESGASGDQKLHYLCWSSQS